MLFATRGKKHRKYRGFGLPIHPTHWYLRCFLLREFQKRAKTPSIWRFSATTESRQKAAGVTPTPIPTATARTTPTTTTTRTTTTTAGRNACRYFISDGRRAALYGNRDEEYRDPDGAQNQTHFVQACAIEMHLNISYEASEELLDREVFRQNATAQIEPRTRTYILRKRAQSKYTLAFHKKYQKMHFI